MSTTGHAQRNALPRPGPDPGTFGTRHFFGPCSRSGARLNESRPPYGQTRSPRAHLGLHSHGISPLRLPGQVVVAGAAGGVPGWPKSLSGAFSERVFRLAGGPSIYWGRLGWPSSGSFCAGMAPDAGSEPLAGPPASAVSLRARSRAADIARSHCPDFGHLDAFVLTRR